MTDGENDEESVDQLLERAESMIRENMQSNQANVPATSAAAVKNEWVQRRNAQEGNSVDIDIESILVNSVHNSTNQIQESVHAYRKLRK